MANDIIHLNGFSVRYPERAALKNITLKIKENETYAILGPSGCGKTTLLYALAELLPTQCVVEGACNRLRSIKTSTVLQDFGLFPWKTVLENTLLPLILNGTHTINNLEKAHEILKWLKLDSHCNFYPGALSGGQKQRVAIARSWLSAPDLLLLDEPFSSLDALTRELLQSEVLELNKKSPLTILIVTHSIEEAVFMGKNIILLSQHGEIQAEIENPSFGLADVREQVIFYEQCLELRKIMKEV